ncbi:MAG: DUF4380 domain-containing protein [Cytophagaceae bacterium]|nr:DUF4380 domain-containing protein [Cytophagaceae bacterium]
MKNLFLLLTGFIFILSSCSESKKETKTPILSKADTVYTFNFAGQKLSVDPDGGRIISFQHEGKEMIGPGGSTFWTSPQSAWNWPPVKEHQEVAYKDESKGDTLILRSQKDTTVGVEIIKMIFANLNDSTFTVRYGIVNKNDSTIRVAHWENTRTFKTALIFYPKGNTDSSSSNPVFGKLKLSSSDGINWFKYDSSRIGDGKTMAKLFADGAEGWIAESNDGLLLIKKFKDLSAAEVAPGEGEIEVFSDFGSPFSEMEQQGPYAELKPNETAWWEVTWILRKLPEGVKTEEGNAKLVEVVRGEIK